MKDIHGEPLRVVHYYRELLRPSGVTDAILGWQEATIESGLETVVFHGDSNGTWRLPHRVVPHTGTTRQFAIPRLKRYLKSTDILILHEGWVLSNVAAARAARSLEIPYVVVPHGVYEPEIMRDLKYSWLGRESLEKHMLRHATAVHTFYESENALVHRLAPRAPVFTLPTGRNLIPSASWSGEDAHLLWFGRYSVKHKGLDRLLMSLATIPPKDRPKLRLYGHDYHSGRAEVERLIEAFGLRSVVEVNGPLVGEEKWHALSRAAGFIFPSRWESQGISLLEALAVGVPCLVSDDIHMAPSLAGAGAADIGDFGDFVGTGQKMVRLAANGTLNSLGRKYVDEQLGWKTIRNEYKKVLMNVANPGPTS